MKTPEQLAGNYVTKAHLALTDEEQRQMMLQLLNLRRDKRYRAGVIQLAVLLGVITDPEWQVLSALIRAGERNIK